MRLWRSGGSVLYVSRLDRKVVNELYGKAVAGLRILQPIENYLHSQLIKAYEYMAAGLPPICSDSPGLKRVADESWAGICVDPDVAGALTVAIGILLDDGGLAQGMGFAGYEYVASRSSWGTEAVALCALYEN